MIKFKNKAKHTQPIENFTSGTTFTSDSLQVVLDEAITNAMDRTIAY